MMVRKEVHFVMALELMEQLDRCSNANYGVGITDC